ncbi:MAG TPA: serine protease [Anaerolineaceae bacterium]
MGNHLWNGRLISEPASKYGIDASIGMPVLRSASALWGIDPVTPVPGYMLCLLQCAFTLRSSMLRPRQVDFNIELSTNYGAPIILDAFPTEAFNIAPYPVTLTAAPDGTLAVVSNAKPSGNAIIHYGVVHPIIRFYGIQESRACWRFEAHPKAALEGSRKMFAMLAVPDAARNSGLEVTFDLKVYAHSSRKRTTLSIPPADEEMRHVHLSLDHLLDPRMKPEANPESQPMTHIAADEIMLERARAICEVRVMGASPQDAVTGTGFLLSPHLLLTCWHLFAGEALDNAPAALQKKAQDALFTFGYTQVVKGVQYRASSVAYCSPELDAILVRLVDRRDHPLQMWGFLPIERDLPLTHQTELVILQHPFGQPLQRSSGFFMRRSTVPNRILYSSPTGAGSSGSPVVNRASWKVAALHCGENRDENLREGILLSAILDDLQKTAPVVYQELAG